MEYPQVYLVGIKVCYFLLTTQCNPRMSVQNWTFVCVCVCLSTYTSNVRRSKEQAQTEYILKTSQYPCKRVIYKAWLSCCRSFGCPARIELTTMINSSSLLTITPRAIFNLHMLIKPWNILRFILSVLKSVISFWQHNATQGFNSSYHSKILKTYFIPFKFQTKTPSSSSLKAGKSY